jgi:DNA-directed RNA polymerase specialized sigma24 family protein
VTEPAPKTRHYIDNAALTKSLGDWADECRAAKKAKRPPPRLPDDVAEAAVKIAKRLVTKPQFCYYTFTDEMASDALLNVCLYAQSFDREKSTNGFAYITQICHNAIIRRLTTEKKASYVAAKLFQESGAILNSPHLKESGQDIIDSYESFLKGRKQTSAKSAKVQKTAV